jgi:GNAT superfamily N-acetyltransferase
MGSETTHPNRMARAIEVFVRGFAFTRSFTHPCQAERVGPLWLVRDAPRQRGDYRIEEWTAYGVAPEEVDALVRVQARGRYAICAICPVDQPSAPLAARFKALGYRLGRTEPLMVHPLGRLPQGEAPARIERVMTVAMAERLARVARTRLIRPDQLSPDAPVRQYLALIDDQIVGWVRSIVVGDATWCANMFVNPPVRRQGIGRALLGHLLQDDRRYGAHLAVLLATHTGAKLYAAAGYEQIGTLLYFTPRST